MKPKWSCTQCGMTSSRRQSVDRHNGNLHGGNGKVIPFTEYLAGRVNGSYPPGPKPSFGAKANSINNKIQEEIENTFVKRVVDKCLPAPGDPIYSESADMAKATFLKRCADNAKC